MEGIESQPVGAGRLAHAVGRVLRSISSRCSCTRETRVQWSDFFSLDLRGSWTWVFDSGDLSAVVDLTNATNRRNECCVVLEMEDTSALEAEVDHWLPALINIGFTYRWRSRR